MTILSLLIHCADISNPTRSSEVAEEWAKRLTEEQFIIGDKRNSLGLPVGVFMDRAKPNIVKNQIGFINFVIKPSFSLLSNALTVTEALKGIEANIVFWNSYKGSYSK